MNHHGALRKLPVELLSMIFDDLSLPQLLAASHVSHFWRAAAMRHQKYWRDVKLAALSTSALDFFHARLDAGGERSVKIRILLPEVAFPARFRSVVLPAVSRNLFRVDRLYLDVDIAFDVDILLALRHPAPRIITLDMSMIHDRLSSDAMTDELFAGHAPNLRYVQLLNVQLYANRLPRAFSAITVLNYCFDEAQSFPTAVFTHCRSLQKLTIYGKYCSLVLEENVASAPDIQKLRFVDLSVFTGGFDLMQYIPCASIPQISAPINDTRSAALLLSHLRGPLEVRMHDTPDELYVQYRSLDTGMERSFLCLPAQIAEAYLPPAYIADNLVSRVQSLHSTGTSAGLMPAFRTLPACTRVALTLTESESLGSLKRPLIIPQLQHIDISSRGAARLNTHNLVVFLEAAFVPVSRVVQVALTGVSLDGDLAVIPHERFVISQNAQPL